MTDDLTRAIAEALGCIEATFMPWASSGGTYIKEGEGFPTCGTHVARQGWPCSEATRIAAALAPLIEARVREARADALTEAADEMEFIIANGDVAEVAAPVEGEVGRASAVSKRDRLYEDPVEWVRLRAEEARRG